jgi:tetracycline repressor-like protein
MLTLARTGRIDMLSGGVCKSEDFAAVKDRMASFMAAGFLAICKPSKGKTKT